MRSSQTGSARTPREPTPLGAPRSPVSVVLLQARVLLLHRGTHLLLLRLRSILRHAGQGVAGMLDVRNGVLLLLRQRERRLLQFLPVRAVAEVLCHDSFLPRSRSHIATLDQ